MNDDGSSDDDTTPTSPAPAPAGKLLTLVPPHRPRPDQPEHQWHGQPGSYEALAENELFMRDVVQLRVEGYSYRAIGEYMGIAWPTMLKLAKRVPSYLHEETRALSATWRAVEFMRLESATKRLLPYVMEDESGEPPNPKHVASYKSLVNAKIALLGMTHDDSADDDNVDDDAAERKAKLVGRYMELADKLVSGIAQAGYGSGRAPEDDSELAEELDDMSVRADNSGTIEDAVVLDPRGPATENELDSEPGQWRDGKFYPDTGDAS